MTAVTISKTFAGVTETFTFPEGWVENISSTTSSTPDVDAMPGSAPGDTIGFDLNGAGKTITVSGKLYEAAATVVAGRTVLTIASQKRWLEAIQSGFQSLLSFTSNYEEYTPKGDMENATNFYAFVSGSVTYATKVLMTSIKFDENAGLPNELPFSIQLTVVGVSS